jgi:hypothetical protein
MLGSFVILALLGAALLVERKGISYNGASDGITTVSGDRIYTESVDPQKECLLVYDSAVRVSDIYYQVMEYILDSLSVGYDVVDLDEVKLPDLNQYQTMVLAITDLSYLKEELFDITQWVYQGGSLMNAYTYASGNYFNLISGKLGIIDGGTDYSTISEIDIEDGFMIGAEHNLKYDPTDTSLEVILDEECKVYIKNIDNQNPLLWERDYGSGKFVVVNIEEYSKTNRGLLSAAYSLLQEAFAYPVINASAFYIDDFPAEIPEGDNEYITRDYHMSIGDFYMNVWWPTLLEWEEKYGIVHTGMIIETYSDTVNAPFHRQTYTRTFSMFGNMLLNHGGEIGIHGYNHMPLCTYGFDYMGLFDSYRLWPSKEAMRDGLEELMGFSYSLFPSANISVYVPPSNVLSKEGREVLVKDFPNIKTIASSYLPLDNSCEYVQEFDVGSDGVINTPRIVAGCMIDDYMDLAAFSELNFHYVQSHFLHADDNLDEDRGAALGWGRLSEIFEDYLSWIYQSAPNIRNVTGSQMGQAVEEYDKLSLRKTYTEQGLDLKLGGFSGEAYLMLRINEGEPTEIQGGEYEHITGNLYLIHATTDEVNVTWKN